MADQFSVGVNDAPRARPAIIADTFLTCDVARVATRARPIARSMFGVRALVRP